MGCWNATCSLTNLPIFAGDKIVVIPLMKKKNNKEPYYSCYPTDTFVPLSLPVVGKYNDYGGIEDIEPFEENESGLMGLKYFTLGGHFISNDKEFYVKDFQSLLNAICSHEVGYYMPSGAHRYDERVLIDYMMMHYDAYKFVVDEIANRKFYNHEETIKESFVEEFQKIILQYNDLVGTKSGYFSDDSPGNIAPIFYMMNKHGIFMQFTEFLSPESTLVYTNLSEAICGGNQRAFDSLVDLKLFTYGLTALRKGYLVASGAGSQSRETQIHYRLADFIMKFIDKKTREFQEENDEEPTNEHGEEETFFS